MTFEELVRWYAAEYKVVNSEPYTKSVNWKDYQDALDKAMRLKIAAMVTEVLNKCK